MNDSKNRFKDFESINCDACGDEFFAPELSTVKLSGFKSVLRVCESCKSREPAEQYATAASILKDIAKITEASSSPEERLARIRDLLGE